MPPSLAASAALLLTIALPIVAQDLPSTFPHNYSGIPTTALGPEWQSYFEVTEPLPNVTFPLGRNWAGNIPVGREGHPNDTLFFWAFETKNGSLTAPANTSNDEPWGIWLNGGPGSSSMVGLTFENGPIRIQNDYSATSNNFSFDKIADYIWIDQPIGTGFSTADATGYIADEDQMGSDFFGFLANLVKVFPSLATRPLHLTGESYAGTYIPYITKTYFGLQNPPVNLVKIAIGDGTIASVGVFEQVPTLTVMETYPQVIGYDQEVFEYFKEQTHLCKYDINLTYPQDGILPSVELVIPSDPARLNFKTEFSSKNFFAGVSSKYSSLSSDEKSFIKRSRENKRHQWKRDLSRRANGTIDSWYGCFVWQEMLDYAINFTFPWTLGQSDPNDAFDVYNIPDALFPEAPMDASVFMNGKVLNNRTRAAIHAPTSKDWVESFDFPFGSLEGDPSPEPMVFLTELATNATEKSVGVVIYSGNDDSLVSHRGSEIAIQNTTFGGIQGFTRKPSTPWFDDEGNFAGIVHQERNWTYILVHGAGHLVPAQNPVAAFTFLREFVFGQNETGLITNSSGSVSVVGGEVSSLAADVMPGQAAIYYGSGTTESTFFFSSATVAAWDDFIATATATHPGSASQSTGANASNGTSSNSGSRVGGDSDVVVVVTIPLLVSIIYNFL